MKKTFMVITLLIILCIVASCDAKQDRATMRVILQKDRSITPDGYSLDIDHYRITGSGPGGASFNIETSRQSVSLEGLIIGEWTIQAEGLNKDDDVLVTGETTHHLSTSNGSVVIYLETLAGEGSLSLVLTWDAERTDIENTSIEITLTEQYGSKEEIELEEVSIDKNTGRAEYSGVNLPSGSYILSARLYSGSVQIAGFVEAVRIAGDQVSEGEIVFDLDKYPTEPGSLEIINKTGVPVVCTITGIKESVSADIPVTVSIICNTDDVSDFQIEWFLDGESIGEGHETTFTPQLGTHRLDVLASTSRLGTAGSTSVNFEAVSATDPGVPSEGNMITKVDDDTFTGSNIIDFLPDGKVLIISNDNQSVKIAKVIRSELDVEREYSFASLGLAGGVSAVASAKATDSLYKIIITEKYPAHVYVFNYNPTGCSLSAFSDAELQVKASGNGGYEGFSEIRFAGMTNGIMKNGAPVGFVGAKNAVAGLWQSLVVNTGNPDDLGFKYSSSAGIRGQDDNLTAVALTVTDKSEAIITYEGYMGYSTKTNSNSEFTLYDALTSLDIGKIDIDLDKIRNIRQAAAIDYKTYLFIGDYITVFEAVATRNPAFKILYSEPFTGNAEGLVISDDGKFAYYIDMDSSELVTLDLMNGTSFKEIGRTKLADNTADTIIISGSGTNLIVFDENSTSSLSIMRVSR